MASEMLEMSIVITTFAQFYYRQIDKTLIKTLLNYYI